MDWRSCDQLYKWLADSLWTSSQDTHEAVVVVELDNDQRRGRCHAPRRPVEGDVPQTHRLVPHRTERLVDDPRRPRPLSQQDAGKRVREAGLVGADDAASLGQVHAQLVGARLWNTTASRWNTSDLSYRAAVNQFPSQSVGSIKNQLWTAWSTIVFIYAEINRSWFWSET